MTRPLWKKAEARAALEAMAKDVARFFNVPAPAVTLPEGYDGRDWEWRTDTIEVWTKAGRAELNVTISARFAHRYFRFDDPARAKPFDSVTASLNPFSGKWNRIAAAPDDLAVFQAYLIHDWRKVAEPNPPAGEVAAYRAKEAANAARWAPAVETPALSADDLRAAVALGLSAQGAEG